MKNEQRRSGRFPIAEIEFSSPELPGKVVEISRTGMRVETALAAETGQTVTATLVYRGEVVEIAGVVRWRREGGRDRAHEDLPFWEVGVAFTAVGEASADGIWRGLAAHDAPPI